MRRWDRMGIEGEGGGRGGIMIGREKRCAEY
jgi:hypothetical protein